MSIKSKLLQFLARKLLGRLTHSRKPMLRVLGSALSFWLQRKLQSRTHHQPYSYKAAKSGRYKR